MDIWGHYFGMEKLDTVFFCLINMNVRKYGFLGIAFNGCGK